MQHPKLTVRACDSRYARFDTAAQDRRIISKNLTVAGAHQGKESAGRLIVLNDGASIGASHRYVPAEIALDESPANRLSKTDLTR